jgi:hypothetical protein
LAAYPEMLLGTMFHERNKSLISKEKYIFFFLIEMAEHFITIWNFIGMAKSFGIQVIYKKLIVTKQEFEMEIDYFQIRERIT